MPFDFDSIVWTAPQIVKDELDKNKTLRERPDYHPEESAYEHIRIVTERLSDTKDMTLVMSGVFHDIMKAALARPNPKTGWPTSPGHGESAALFIDAHEEIQKWILAQGADLTKVKDICYYHMRMNHLQDMRADKAKSYIQKWKDAGVWEYLQVFSRADDMLTEWNSSRWVDIFPPQKAYFDIPTPPFDYDPIIQVDL